jgi:3-hydroxyisobutyrate dehydrogenase
MEAGFIGLGYLGKTIAQRLIAEGVELTVWNRTREKSVDLGVPIADTPSQLAQRHQVILLNLFDSNAVRSVLAGRDGLLGTDLSGKVIIDTTTNHFTEVVAFHSILKECGARYVEAPVLGSVVPASQGNLVILVSGEEAAFEQAKPYIEKLGTTIFFLPEQGLATKMKLINNLLLGTFMAAIAEATVLGEASGIDKVTALDIFGAGAGSSMVLNAKRQKLLTGDFSTHFSSALIYKDLHYLQDLAKSLRRPLLTGSLIKELFGMTFRNHKEGLDFSAVYEVLKGL